MKFKVIRSMMCRWAWSQLNKDSDGNVSLTKVVLLKQQFKDHVAAHGDISALIQQCETSSKKNCDLEKLLAVC